MANLPLSPSMKAGDLVFTAGQLGTADGRLVDGGIAAQTKQAIANLETILKGHGLTLQDIVKTTCWITRGEDFPGFNEAYATAFAGHKPARSTTIAGLVLPGGLVEIEAVAALRK